MSGTLIYDIKILKKSLKTRNPLTGKPFIKRVRTDHSNRELPRW
jgi:hypothetical protein